jgi:uncharacterized protein
MWAFPEQVVFRQTEYGEGGSAAPSLDQPQTRANLKEAAMTAPELDTATRTEFEAAAFRRLVEHLRERTDVQNIDLMNLAGFCRNCMSRWYREAAEARGIPLADPDAREIVYGMPYKEWQARYQGQATPEQKAGLAQSHPGHEGQGA